MTDVVAPVQDQQTVRADGSPVDRLIDGVVLRPAVLQADERGSICEMLSEGWPGFDQPIVHVYQVVVRPGRVKGWVVHYHQSDRVFVSQGAIKFVMYDPRPGSPTYGLINELCVTDQNRALLLVPPGVIHGLQNVGHTDAVFINMPTKAYNYEDPDKHRIPLDSDVVPYRFNARLGW